MNAHQLARHLGATDLFVLAVTDGGRFFNLEGVGRGHGWAGNISIHPEEEPLLAAALLHGRARRRSGIPFRAFGPYWTTEVVAIKTSWGLVVAGGPSLSEAEKEELDRVADWDPGTIASARGLDADAIELEQAVDAIERIYSDDPHVAGKRVAEALGRALSCDFAALLLTTAGLELFPVDLGWVPTASPDEMTSAMLPLLPVAALGPLVEQDLATSALAYRPFSYEDGLVSRIVLPVGNDAARGLLIAAHAEIRPRGFTAQCQRVATEMCGAADRVLSGDLARAG